MRLEERIKLERLTGWVPALPSGSYVNHSADVGALSASITRAPRGHAYYLSVHTGPNRGHVLAVCSSPRQCREVFEGLSR